MNKQPTPLRLFFRLLCASVICLLASSGSSTAMAAQSADSCALLKPADLTALLGGAVTAKDNAGACAWTAAGSSRKLIAARMKATGPGAEMAYMGARMNASDGGKVKVADETGLGDKAFSVMPSFGIAMFMLKHGQLLQLQYWTGTTGTARDLDALRPVAKKAIAAF
jgi:hypothetical protein